LRAVEQRQAFLGPEYDRLQPMRHEGDLRRHAAMRCKTFADADHDGRHVRQRREVAGRADRSLCRDNRNDVVCQHGFEQRDGFWPHAGRALREAGELQRHHQPRDRNRHRFADASCMGQHDVTLQCFEVRGWNAHAGKLSEAGVDAVDRLALGNDARNRGRTRGDFRLAGRIERRHCASIDGAPVGKCRVAGFQNERSHWPLQTRECSGLNPMR
jgi:hypothetical protein